MPDPVVIDTVDLRYFLFVGRGELLVALLGRPLMVPRIVFDPDEGDVPEEAMSEITRSIRWQGRTSGDAGRLAEMRRQAAHNAASLEEVFGMHARGEIETVDLDDEERALFARLTTHAGAADLGLRFRLQDGEAACVAAAVGRGWVLVTDDADALRALDHLEPGHPYERIRRLLQRAATEGRVTEEEANDLHAQMRSLGFRDREVPFP
jgi:hypothetical protein